MYLPTPLHGQDLTQSQFQAGFDRLEFYFSKTDCHTKVKEPSLPYFLRKVRERIIRWITFARVLALCEMQIAYSRIWTWDNVYISFDDNYYTMSASILYINREKLINKVIQEEKEFNEKESRRSNVSVQMNYHQDSEGSSDVKSPMDI